MPTDWRGLFDAVGVRWVDKGPNARRGNVNIKCPFCPDDPSEHMLVSEDNVGYYCHRDPQRHSGTNFMWLMRHVLGSTTHHNLITLFNQYAVESLPQARGRLTNIPTNIEQQWSRFTPAYDNDIYLDYLWSRGFPDPVSLCTKYDLRYSPVGKWAMRLLIPITTYNGAILNWTGRAIRKRDTLRYMTEKSEHDGMLYVPRQMRAIAIPLEGPMDVLKIASATEQLPISPIGLLGLGVNDARVIRLVQTLRQSTHCYFSLDSTVSPGAYQRLRSALAIHLPAVYIDRLRLPRGYDDAGEMPVPEIVEWLSELLRGIVFHDRSTQNNN